jgi:hypothetical protein
MALYHAREHQDDPGKLLAFMLGDRHAGWLAGTLHNDAPLPLAMVRLPPCQQSRPVRGHETGWDRAEIMAATTERTGSGRHIVMAEGAGDPVRIWGTSPGWVQGCWWLAGVGQQLIR